MTFSPCIHRKTAQRMAAPAKVSNFILKWLQSFVAILPQFFDALI